jgi:hypothetical protein
MEATGNSQWFIELVQDLGHKIWIGDAAHAEKKLITSPRRPPILALAIAAGDSKTFFAAFGDQRSVWFAISTDLRKTWGNHTPLPQGTHRFLVDPTPDIEVPDIYAVGKVSIAARLSCPPAWKVGRSPLFGWRKRIIGCSRRVFGQSIGQALSCGWR